MGAANLVIPILIKEFQLSPLPLYVIDHDKIRGLTGLLCSPWPLRSCTYLYASHFTTGHDHRFTLAVGERTPGAVLQARDGLQLVSTGEGETIVALEGGCSSPGHIGGNHRKPIVNLGHWSAVGFDTVGNVVVVPFTSRLAHGDHLPHARGEEVSGGAGEADHGAKSGSSVRHDCALSWLKLGTIRREDS